MEKKTLTEALKNEIGMREREYNILIDEAIEMLQAAKRKTPSTHLGHNLAGRASELAATAGKIAANLGALNFAEGK